MSIPNEHYNSISLNFKKSTLHKLLRNEMAKHRTIIGLAKGFFLHKRCNSTAKVIFFIEKPRFLASVFYLLFYGSRCYVIIQKTDNLIITRCGDIYSISIFTICFKYGFLIECFFHFLFSKI